MMADPLEADSVVYLAALLAQPMVEAMAAAMVVH